MEKKKKNDYRRLLARLPYANLFLIAVEGWEIGVVTIILSPRIHALLHTALRRSAGQDNYKARTQTYTLDPVVQYPPRPPRRGDPLTRQRGRLLYVSLL